MSHVIESGGASPAPSDAVLRASWALLAPHAAAVLPSLVARLGALHAPARRRFPASITDAHGREAIAIVDRLVATIGEPHRLVREAASLARREGGGMSPAEVRGIAEAFLYALDQTPLGPLGPAERRAWREAVGLACSVAQRASGSVRAVVGDDPS